MITPFLVPNLPCAQSVPSKIGFLGSWVQLTYWDESDLETYIEINQKIGVKPTQCQESKQNMKISDISKISSDESANLIDDTNKLAEVFSYTTCSVHNHKEQEPSMLIPKIHGHA